MNHKRLFTIGLVLSLSFFVSIQMVSAQREQCVALAEATFGTLENSCATLGASSACFGMASSVDSATTFGEAGDTLALTGFNSLTTLPLNLETASWGIARLNVPANVQLSVAENGLTYILIGDATLENVVAPESAFVPALPVTLQTLVGANLRTADNTDARVLASAPVGAELLATGINRDGTWLYVTFEGQTAWVSTQIVVATNGVIADLPVISNDARTLFQSFVLQTGNEESECSTESPSMLVIQAPEGVNATVTANGADFRFSGTIVLRTTLDNLLQLFVLNGDASNGVWTAPTGFTVSAQLSEGGQTSNGVWTKLGPISDSERGWLGILELLPEPVMYTAVTVPTQEEVATILRSLNQGAVGGNAGGASSAGSGSCQGFQVTSPLDGLGFDSTVVYWDGTDLASQYQVNVYGSDGSTLLSNTIDAFTTTTTINTSPGSIGNSPFFGLGVSAISNGQVICTTGQVTLLRQAAPQAARSGSSNSNDGGGSDNTWGN